MSENDIKPLAERRVAFIGCGSMGTALVRGIARSGLLASSQISVFDPARDPVQQLATELGIQACTEAADATKDADLILLAVKPKVVEEVVRTLPNLRTGFPSPVLVSVAAGVRIAQLEHYAGAPLRIVRAMPNLACEVGQGVSCLFSLDADDLAFTRELFALCGSTLVVEREEELDAVTGLSGSGPAYVALFLEALIDGGVRIGLSRNVAHQLATETVRGAASLLIEKQLTPAELKYLVSSPGGTTIAGLQMLENGAVRGSIISAVEAAMRRSVEQGKK